MKITIPDKKIFLSSFLSPISKISDSCVISLTDSGLSCVTCTADAAIILHAQYNLDLDIDKKFELNIADVKKVYKAFECINSDSFVFDVDKNNISYSGVEIRFKYHLLEEGIITKPKINVEKIGGLDFPLSFTVQYKSLVELLRGSTFATESNKLYIYSENNKIFGDLTDKARHNVDSMSIPLCEYNGPEIQTICLNFELIRIISGVRVKQLECRVNPKIGIVVFQTTDSTVKTQYIASSLIK